MVQTLFRKKALERLSSPDNIHELVQVTSSRSWLALLALSGLVVALIAWSIFGELPKNVKGQGIVIQSGGIAEITLLGSGIVNQILVEEGENVSKDDTIAIVAQPELQLQIANAQDKLAYLREKRDKIIRYNILDPKIKELYQEKYDLEDRLGRIEKEMRLLEERLMIHDKLGDKNNTKPDKVNQDRLRYIRLQRVDFVLQNELQKINSRLLGVNIAQGKELEDLEGEIQDLKREIEELNVRLSLSAYVKSPYEGKVIELMTKRGQLIEAGAPVVSMEVASRVSSDLEAIIYVPPNEGKKITEGMTARVAPSTVKIEEYGYIEGVVLKVSEYPSTSYGMARVLGSKDLVQTFSREESPIAITVRLKKAKTPSHYQWTSGTGPDIEIKAGTLCEANIITAQQSPISLLFPFLNKQLAVNSQ